MRTPAPLPLQAIIYKLSSTSKVPTKACINTLNNQKRMFAHYAQVDGAFEPRAAFRGFLARVAGRA